MRLLKNFLNLETLSLFYDGVDGLLDETQVLLVDEIKVMPLKSLHLGFNLFCQKGEDFMKRLVACKTALKF